MSVSRWLLVAAVASIIFLASMTGLVYLQLGGQITSLQSQVSSLKDEVYRYAYPVTLCQENGTAACNRALASVASQNPRFLSLENGTAYTYYMTSDENSHIINNAVMSHDLIFVANMTDLANTSAIWVRVPITGSTASYAGDYDLADATFAYYPPNQIVSIQF